MKIFLPPAPNLNHPVTFHFNNVSCVIFRVDFYLCEKMCVDEDRYLGIFIYIIFPHFYTNSSFFLSSISIFNIFRDYYICAYIFFFYNYISFHCGNPI